MKPSIQHVKLAQTLVNLALHGKITRLEPDGMVGPKTRAAFIQYLGVDLEDDRLVAGVIQSRTPATLDFWWGPETEHYADERLDEVYQRPKYERPDEDPAAPDEPRCWKPTDRQMIDEYGPPGSNLTMIDLPFPLRLAWNPATIVTRMTIHQMLAERAQDALLEIKTSYTKGERHNLGLDLFGGCFNKRKKRGGSTWSAHAFGAAIDWDPAANKLRWNSEQASLSKPQYDKWWDAWHRQGFIGLGPCYDFDWMHVQANPLSGENLQSGRG